jgi:hypothetical protein
MALDKRQFANVAGAAKGQQIFFYATTADALATVTGSGYFNHTDLAGQIVKGDVIFINASDKTGAVVVNAVDTAAGTIGVATLITGVAHN